MDSRATILIVDDDRQLRKSLSDILKAKGYAPVVATKGKTALVKVRKAIPAVAVIDLKLEDMSGLEVMGEIKKLSPDTECIMLTGYASQESAIEAVNLGAYAYMQKPYDMEQLPLTIRRAVEKVEARRILDEWGQRYRGLVENANDIIYTHDLEGNFTSVNPSATRIYGFTSEEVMQLNIAEIVDPEYLPLARQKIMEKFEGTLRTGPYELLTYTKSGAPIWVEVSTRLLKSDSQPVEVQGIARDITERKRAEEGLRDSEEKYRTLVEQSLQGVAIVQDFSIVFGNPALAEITGHTIEDLMAFSPEEVTALVHPEDQEVIWGRFGDRLQGKPVPSRYECRVIRRDGAVRWVEIIPHIVDYQGKPAVQATFVDVTERRRAEDELGKRTDELAALNAIARTMAGSLDLDEIMDQALEMVLDVMGVDAGVIRLLDLETKEVTLAAHSGLGDNFPEAARRRPIVDGITETVVNSGEPLLIEDLSADPRAARMKEASEGKLRSLVAAPLRSKNQIMGMLAAISRDSHEFTPRDVELLTSIGSQVGMAVENASLYQEEMRRVFEMEALRKTTLDITRQLNMAELLRSIVERAAALAGTKGGGLYLYHPDEDELELVVSHFPNVDTDYTGTRLKIGEGLSGNVMLTGEPLIVEDYAGWPARSGEYNGAPFRAVMAVPLKWGDKIVGVLNVTDLEQPRTFTERDLWLQELFASQAAIAIENARLYEETERRLRESTTLQEISRLVNSSLEPEQIFQTMVESVASAFGYDLVNIYILDGEGLILGAEMGYDPSKALDSIPLDQGVSGRVARSGEGELIQNVSQDPDFLGAAPGIVSEITVPIKRDHQVLGVLGVESTASEPLTEADFNLISAISHQISVAIQNARLYEETKKRLDELSVLHEASIAATSTLNFTEILERIVEVLQSTLGFSNLTLMLLDEEDERLKIRAGTGYSPEVAEKVQPSVGEGITGSVALTGEPQNVPDVTKDARYIMGDEKIRSELCVPLEVGNKIIGVLNVESPDLAAFADDDLRLLSTLAGQLTVIIENARLFESLGESEERFRGIFENAMLGLYRTTPDGRILVANPALVRMLGFSSFEELAQRNLEEKWYRPEYPRSAFKRRCESEGQVVGLESAWKRYDGTTLFIRESARAIRDEAGNTLYYEGSVEDITQQKRAEEDLQQSHDRLERALEETVNALASMAEKRDPYTAGHQQGVASLACAIAEKMDLPDEQLEGIRVAGSIHDIGKIYVPAEILSKPGKLTDIEFRMIQAHPEAVYDILRTVEFPWPVADTVLQHHEKMDGSGYPHGLSGDEILLQARILAVADVVEAMASHRPYRPAHDIDEALEEIQRNSGVLYDPSVVNACVKLFAEDGFQM